MAETFPAILCRLRKERGLNQRTAAADLHISQALLSHYENGLREPGLAMLFFAACGKEGSSLFDPSLTPRTGEYAQYHHGDINAFHLSFFRRKEKDERRFHTCNLRKSYGFYLAAQGADPLPNAEDAEGFYRLSLLKQGPDVRFAINDLEVLTFHDDGQQYGPLLGGGCIGLRQLAPMAGDYANLRVFSVKKD